MVTEAQLKEQGERLISARRRLWDIERKLGIEPWNSFLKEERKIARREYNRLLRERKELVSQAQGRLL